jgi:hypothetical protein
MPVQDRARDLTPTSVRRLALAALVLAASACEGERPRIEARPQTIAFSPAPEPGLNQATVTVSATATSGLPVRYGSATPDLCTVGEGSGIVTASASGTCTIEANQPGDTRYAPAPRVTQDVVFTFADVLEFAPAPSLGVHDLATVSAVASSGAPVAFASATPSVCVVDAVTGLVAALSAGDCIVVARAGELEAAQTIAISAPTGATAPNAPTGVAASAGEAADSVTVRVGGVRAGGSPVTGYGVTSSPAGVTAASATLPIAVTCSSSCAGYRFSVTATNEHGTSPPSEPGEIVTRYQVVATFREPDTQPNDTLFVGAYTLNASTGVVTGLRGELSESMTGGATPYPDDTMSWLTLAHQLSSVPITLDGVGGLLVTAFLLGTTDTLSTDPRFGGTDGWSPGSGMGLHFGFPGPNPGNAYAMIFVDPVDPTASLTQAQIDRLAYADCTPRGMMGSTCMTGTADAVYGTAGTMGGHPVSQLTTRP